MLDPGAILYYADRPVEFVTDIIRATPDDYQTSILQSVAERSMTSVRSGHGVGKSAVESWSIIWFLCTRPFPKIPCTAPTKHQLYDILWAEISKWIRNNPALEREIVWTQEKVYLKGYSEEWFAVPRTATKPDALQGFHAEHVLYIIDEASGVDDKIFEPVLGALTTAGAKLLMCGNPTKLTGFFFDSHHKNRSIYGLLHLDSRNSKRVSTDYVNTIIDMYGEDSDVFRVRVAGDFPKALPDSFIPMEWCERNSKTTPLCFEPTRIDIGVDVARFGDDSSVICPVFDKKAEQSLEIYHHNDTMQIAGHTVAMIKRYARLHVQAKIHVKIDCDGLGVGVYDRLHEQREAIAEEINAEREAIAEEARAQGDDDAEAMPFTLEVYECHFGGEGGVVTAADPVEFENSTGLMWGTVREALRTCALTLIYDDKQITQLSNRRYSINSAGKIELERKEAMKRRGLSSPDIADALGLALYDPYAPSWSLEVD